MIHARHVASPLLAIVEPLFGSILPLVSDHLKPWLWKIAYRTPYRFLSVKHAAKRDPSQILGPGLKMCGARAIQVRIT